MAKMNRRDYLKWLGVGTAAIAGSKIDVFAQRGRRRLRRSQAKPANKVRPDPSILNWNITETKPAPDAFVTAIFAGLTGFTYDSPHGVGKVGFHGGHSNSHQLVARIFEVSSSRCQEFSSQPQISASTKN